MWVTERLLLPPFPDKVAEHISPHKGEYACLPSLAEGPREFIIPPPPPPSPPASPPPSPSPSTATINVQESTKLMEVAVSVRGGSLVPLNSAVQKNVLLAANNTWLGNEGMTGVSLDSSQESGGGVALRFRVNVAQTQAPAAASFVQTTVDAGTLDLAFRDEGGLHLGCRVGGCGWASS